jgi:hypothetical protein
MQDLGRPSDGTSTKGMIEIKSKHPKKELDIFFWASIVAFALSALLLPFLAVATIPLAGRAALLTFHKDIKGEY